MNLLTHEMQQNNRIVAPIHIDTTSPNLTSQYLGIHNGQNIRIHLHPLLLPRANLCRETIVHRLPQPRFQFLYPPLQEQFHNVGQGVFHDVAFPILEGEVRIEDLQLSRCRGEFRFGGEGVVDAGGAVDPGVLGGFPCLLGVFFDVLDLLLCVLDVGFGAGFFVGFVGLFENVLNNRSIPQPPFHPLPRTQMFLRINHHNVLAALIFLILIGSLIIIAIVGFVTARRRRWSANFLIDILGTTGGYQFLPCVRQG
mmetsp:Transcript_7450/g.13129  ORF Transcript_7450/g.13129 Transcript_7450/m.13129 type:complete len:254 (+) Transcript_7450:666-1427(+)